MSLAITYGRARLGVDAPLVTVEVHIRGGLPRVQIVGLPEAAVRESSERVRSAILYSGLEFPGGRVTVNLGPADLPKDGGRFDLPIAMAILAATGELTQGSLEGLELVGELALDGRIRSVDGVLPAALRCRDADHCLVCPRENVDEGRLVRGARVHPATCLRSLYHEIQAGPLAPLPAGSTPVPEAPGGPDLAEVRGQHRARRALEVAAAGEHNLLLIGPPGTGKTMLACRLPGLLPPLDETQALESAAVWSVSSHGFDAAHWGRRPFRAPHHTASAVALVGGGSRPRPGEISLAHHGVLFLDELPEFERRVLEVLREPLESRRIVVSRAARQAEFPASVQLLAAMNPCPCGHLGDGTTRCRCSPDQIQRYRARISGPLLDRIDLHVEVPPLEEPLVARPGAAAPEPSARVRARVDAARKRMLARQGVVNARLGLRDLDEVVPLTREQAQLLDLAVRRLGLSARAIDRVRRAARSIADLADAPAVGIDHLAEAIGYRDLDRRTGEGAAA